MHAINDKLYLASLADVSDINSILQHEINHILTVDSSPLPLDLQSQLKSTGVEIDHVSMLDTLDFEVFDSLKDAVSILHKRAPTIVSVVHCFAGMSRSATVVICYLMQSLGLKYDEAFQYVKSIKPDICPNPNFEKQLRLFEELGNTFDKYREFKRALQRLNGYDQRLEDLKVSLKAAIRGNNTMVSATCRKCRFSLFSECTVSHSCLSSSASIFLQSPEPWMLQNSVSEQDSKILCPACRCKLGSIRWKGIEPLNSKKKKRHYSQPN
ncbi:uncharacterized protein LOC135694168 isoform X3 [Rhopilema esculentum]|uniref:uncharacterized protein LOC135694168 isoform X3 n=1 Tax=Rhopilema esculentum TaxID=499914 RepID=UPI0031D6F5F7